MICCLPFKNRSIIYSLINIYRHTHPGQVTFEYHLPLGQREGVVEDTRGVRRCEKRVRVERSVRRK